MGKKKAEKGTGWASDDVMEFTKGEMVILSEDGETAHFLPLTEPEIQEEDTQWGKRRRAVVQTVRMGDGGMDGREDWIGQELRLSKRAFGKYQQEAAGEEGKTVFKMVRDGGPNNTKTKYHFSAVGTLTDMVSADDVPAALERIAEIAREFTSED